MARTVYHLRKDHVPSHDSGAAEDHHRFRKRALQHLQKKAATLGSQLSPAEPMPQELELFLSSAWFGGYAGRHWYSTSGADSGAGLRPNLTARNPWRSYSARAATFA
jgi:hypothetical protein